MSFEPITHVKITKSGTPLAKGSVAIYKTRLNRLAQAGYDTIQKLVDQADEIIQFLDLFLDDKDDAVEKRYYYSAIFYALYLRPKSEQKPYYDAFQKLKTDYNNYLKK